MQLRFSEIMQVVFLLAISPSLYALSITPVQFSWEIDKENNPVSIIENKTTLKSLPIYVSFAIIGTEYDLTAAAESGTLEVKLEFWVDNRLVRIVPLGITPSQWIRDKDGLSLEVKSRMFFDWRTVGLISKPLGSSIRVRIRDSEGTILAPSGYSEGFYEPEITLIENQESHDKH